MARHRVPEYWLVDPRAHTLEVRVEESGRYPNPVVVTGGTYQSITLPGLALALDPLFA